MTTTIPTWTDPATAQIAPQMLVKGNVLRTTLDLSEKVGADVAIFVGRSSVTGMTGNFFVRARRMFLTKTLSQPAGISYTGGVTTAATSQKIGATTQASALTALVMNATAFVANDVLCFSGHTLTAGATGLTNLTTVAAEFVQFATHVAASTSIYVDAPTLYTKQAAEMVHNLTESVFLWLEGGAQWELILDAASITAGDPLIVAIYYQTYDSDTTT